MSWNARRGNAATFIAVNSPEIDRFQDKLSWRGVLYGPGMPRLPADHLPAAISKGAPPPLKTGRMLQSPFAFDSCDFVDENLVMRQYSSVTDGRCMENMKFANNYKTPYVLHDDSYGSYIFLVGFFYTRRLSTDNSVLMLIIRCRQLSTMVCVLQITMIRALGLPLWPRRLVAGTEHRVWWLYSKNMHTVKKGTHYLVSWLVDRETGEIVTGKYEVTLGPHVSKMQYSNSLAPQCFNWCCCWQVLVVVSTHVT